MSLNEMTLQTTGIDLLMRLLFAAVAGGVLGFNREQRGHAAGFRTTILVTLAAAIAMLQANALLPVDGKTAASFGVIDIGRFPLGILTGVGFIGGGTILKRGDLVTGVTTAATLWIATTIGLCFGGGQIVLGLAGTVLAVFALWALRPLDERIRRQRRGQVTVIGPLCDIAAFLPKGYQGHLKEWRHDGDEWLTVFAVSWRARDLEASSALLLKFLEEHVKLQSFRLDSEAGH